MRRDRHHNILLFCYTPTSGEHACSSGCAGALCPAATPIALREVKLSKTAPEMPGVLYDDQRNAQRVSIARRVKGKTVVLIEGIAFAVGLLMIAVSAYFMAVEAVRKAKRSQ
jgi:hypothetical protein